MGTETSPEVSNRQLIRETGQLIAARTAAGLSPSTVQDQSVQEDSYVSCTRDRRRDVVGSRAMGAVGSLPAVSCQHWGRAFLVCQLRWDVDKNSKVLAGKANSRSPAPSHPRCTMGRTRSCLWKTRCILERQLQKCPGHSSLWTEHPINQTAHGKAELSAKQSWGGQGARAAKELGPHGGLWGSMGNSE